MWGIKVPTPSTYKGTRLTTNTGGSVLRGRGRAERHRGGIRVYIPADIVKDSQFPLKEGRVYIEIDTTLRAIIIWPERPDHWGPEDPE